MKWVYTNDFTYSRKKKTGSLPYYNDTNVFTYSREREVHCILIQLSSNANVLCSTFKYYINISVWTHSRKKRKLIIHNS